LSDSINKHSPEPVGGFQLHYFPNIPVDDPPDDCRNRTHNSDFKRSNFNDIETDPVCPPDPPEPPEPPESVQAEPPVANLEPPIEEIKEGAFQKGFLEGKRVGFESGAKKAEQVIESLTLTLEQLNNIRCEIHQELEQEVTHLALSIAKKIVCHEIKTTRETIVCVAREALARADNPAKVKIKLNPDDLQFINETQSQFTRFMQNFDQIDFEAEDSIQSGGCLIETDRGDIDARIDKQFEAIEEAFRAQLGHSQQENK
jgi:flagellar assembly protein FliH